ncbi:MAG: cyclodeaminase/cyclohydrolase family protein, partial [Oscillospiraceae bacterium]|nr:cyclodeaminase/cyclohydrolase family protein [Oscillospiraceae bacterium]
ALTVSLLDVRDRDTDAFHVVSNAFSMPKDTAEQKAERSAAIQEGLKGCTRTPLEMMELCADAIALTASLQERGFNSSSASDLGVALLSLKSALQSAWLNVLINIGSLQDRDFAEDCRRRGEALLARSLPLADAGYQNIVSMITAE